MGLVLWFGDEKMKIFGRKKLEFRRLEFWENLANFGYFWK